MHRRYPLTRAAVSLGQLRRHITTQLSGRTISTEGSPRKPAHEKSEETAGSRKRVPRDSQLIIREKIVKANAKKNVHQSIWSSPTLSGAPEQAALADSLGAAPAASSSKTPVVDPRVKSNELDEEGTAAVTDWDSEDALVATYEPGTFIELRRNLGTVQAVVLAEVVHDQMWSIVSLTTTGELIQTRRTDVHFVIPAFISSDLAARCGTDTISKDKVASSARVEVIRRLREISRLSENASFATAQMQRKRDLYATVKAAKNNEWGKTSLVEVTGLLHQNPTFVEYLGVHRYMMSDSLHYVADGNYLQSQTFSVRPADDVKNIRHTELKIKHHREDPRNPKNDYWEFVQRARQCLATNQTSAWTATGPPTQSKAAFDWKPSDLPFLTFLLRSLQLYRSTQVDPYALGRSAILKDILQDNSLITDETTHNVLIRLGVIAPWQDLIALLPQFQENCKPPPGSPAALHEEKTLEAALMGLSKGKQIAPEFILGPSDLHPSDPLESVRHDFGDLSVYVVDELSAEELDDGISVEQIPTEPDNLWVHVHIADPSSLLHPSHTISQQARKRVSSLYFVQQSFPLLPKPLMHDPLYGLSLGNRQNQRSFDRVMTFSAKLDGSGHILESKVRAGIVRNVKRLSYDEVDRILGHPPVPRPYPFGMPVVPAQKPAQDQPSLLPQEVENLKLLARVAEIQGKRRNDLGAFSFSSSAARLERIKLPLGIKSPTLEASTFSGFPELEYWVEDVVLEDTGSKNIVAEMAKIACRVASRFGSEHGLPLIRRSLPPPLMHSEEAYADVLAMRTPNGYVDMAKSLDKVKVAFPTSYGLEPMEHFVLGVPADEGYTRATSPLRRYEDLLTHWQIQHALLGPNAPRRPPFTRDDMERLVIEMSLGDREVRKGGKKNNMFFAFMFIKRWMESGGSGGLDPRTATFTAHTIALPRRDGRFGRVLVNAHIQQLGILASVEIPEASDIMPPSTQLEIRLKEVVLGIQRPGLHATLERILS